MDDEKPPLAGNLCSSIHRLKDAAGNEGGFFVFGDISVRATGMWRIMFTVFDLQKDNAGGPGVARRLCTICTSPFTVSLTKDYKGLNESTFLTRAFSDQGVRLRLRKEPRSKRKPSDVSPEPSDDGGDKRRRYDDYPEQQNTGFAGPVQPPTSMQQAASASSYTSPSAYPAYLQNNMQSNPNYYGFSQPQTQPELLHPSFRATASGMQADVGAMGMGSVGSGAVGMGSTDPADYADHLSPVPVPQSRYQERLQVQHQALLSGEILDGGQLNGGQLGGGQLNGGQLGGGQLNGAQRY
jgi:hypothetical protein